VDLSLEGWDIVPEVAHKGGLILTTHCEHPAIDAVHDNFVVLVHAKAPVAAVEACAPLDLTVLDVNGSVTGPKLVLKWFYDTSPGVTIRAAHKVLLIGVTKALDAL
jgi:hypothetical protein